MGVHLQDNKVMTDATRVLMNLSIVEENAAEISQRCVLPTIDGMKIHAQDQVFLRESSSSVSAFHADLVFK